MNPFCQRTGQGAEGGAYSLAHQICMHTQTDRHTVTLPLGHSTPCSAHSEAEGSGEDPHTALYPITAILSRSHRRLHRKGRQTHIYTHVYTQKYMYTHACVRTHTCTCITTARVGNMVPKQVVSQQEATRLVAPLAVGTPTSSPQLHGPLSAVGVLMGLQDA